MQDAGRGRPCSFVPDLSDDSSLVSRHTCFSHISSPARTALPTPHCPLINRVTVRRAAWRPGRGSCPPTSPGRLGFVRSSPPRVPLPGSLVRRHDVVHVHPSQARRHHRPVDLPWSAMHAAFRNDALLPASGLLLQPGGERWHARPTAARGCCGMGDVGFEPNARHRQRHGAAAGCCILD